MRIFVAETSSISTHLIFGKNLRLLCARVGTIAEVADRLEINRVQMNRILNGESFPKPGMLRRICELFDVDARIVLQPLEDLEREKEKMETGVFSTRLSLEYAFYGMDLTISHDEDAPISGYRIPDGIHVIWRPSFTNPAKFISLLVRFGEMGGRRVIRGYDPPSSPSRRRDVGPLASREHRGVLIKSNSGFGILYSSRLPIPIMGVDFFSTHSLVGHGFLTGYTLVMYDGSASGRYHLPIILQPIQQTTHHILDAARKTGYFARSEVPSRYLSYLEGRSKP